MIEYQIILQRKLPVTEMISEFPSTLIFTVLLHVNLHFYDNLSIPRGETALLNGV